MFKDGGFFNYVIYENNVSQHLITYFKHTIIIEMTIYLQKNQFCNMFKVIKDLKTRENARNLQYVRFKY